MTPAPDYQRRLSRISRLSEDFHSIAESRASRQRKRFNESSAASFDVEKCKKEENAVSERPEESKFSCFQACALNTMNMFGTGPLITDKYTV